MIEGEGEREGWWGEKKGRDKWGEKKRYRRREWEKEGGKVRGSRRER